jgi:hypothetical protein
MADLRGMFMKTVGCLKKLFSRLVIQDISRVMMTPAELKMQPTIHFQS